MLLFFFFFFFSFSSFLSFLPWFLTLTKSEVNFPRFDWAHVPVFWQACNASGAFNETAVEILIRYSFVTIEKGQGENGTIPGYYAEDYMLQAAQQLKNADPNIKVFFYWNSVLDWEMYRMHYKFLNHSKWWMRNYTQNVIHMSGDPSFPDYENMLVFDMSQKDCMDFWISECINMTKTGYFDGCDADRVWQLDIGQLNYTTQMYYLNRKLTGMTFLQSYLNASNLSIMFLNFGSPLPGVYGMTLEGFEPTEDALFALLDCVLYRNGNPERLALKVHGGYQFGCSGFEFQNVLAAFLIGVYKYCWFQCSEHYYITPNVGWYPEYNYSLGPPTSDGIKVGDTYIRQFQSGTIATFNVSTGNGTIFWADFFPTPSLLPSWVQDLLIKQHTIGINAFDVLRQKKKQAAFFTD